jgi:hypothetical protein
VLEQDRLMMEKVSLKARLNEKMGQTDIGVIRLRKMINMEFFKQQEVYRQAAQQPKNGASETAADLPEEAVSEPALTGD